MAYIKFQHKVISNQILRRTGVDFRHLLLTLFLVGCINLGIISLLNSRPSIGSEMIRNILRIQRAVVSFGGEDNSESIRILCWIPTHPARHLNAKHLKLTWGRRCDTILLFSSSTDRRLGTTKLENVTEGKDFLWSKTKTALRYIHKHHLEDADWFLRADDDTYVILSNLKAFLANQNSSDSVYFGCRLKGTSARFDNPDGYMAGGAGYVLSKAALKAFVEDGLPNRHACHPGGTLAPEDVHLARCLHAAGVRPGDSRDTWKRFRFFPISPDSLAGPPNLIRNNKRASFYWAHNWYASQMTEESMGMASMSDTVISFHNVTPEQMYMLEYLLYHVQVLGS